MGLVKSLKKGLKKVFGGGSSGPKVVKAPDPKMQTVEQGKGLANIKQQQGALSTLLGGGKSYAEDKPTTNAYSMTGKEYANDKAEFLATNTVKEKDYSKKALNTLAVGAAANPAISGTASFLTGGMGQTLSKTMGLDAMVPGASMLTGSASMLLGGPATALAVKGIDSLTHGAISKTLNSAIKDVKNIGAKLGIGHKHDTKRKLEQIRQNTANKIDNTATLATKTSDDTQGTSKKNKKQQTTSQFLGM